MNIVATSRDKTRRGRAASLAALLSMICIITGVMGCSAPTSPPAEQPAPAPAETPAQTPPVTEAPAPAPAAPAPETPAAPAAAPETPAAPVPIALATDPSNSRATDPATRTALDEYVYKADPVSNYYKIGVKEDPNFTTTGYHLTSQTWLDKTIVDRPLWEHLITITVPKEVKHSNAMMFISGGGYNKDMDKEELKTGPLEQIAVLTKSIVCQIKQIPNQPLHFLADNDPKYAESGRKEDEIIGYGWDKFLVNGDPIWLARLPMTKAVVLAMDVAQKEIPTIDAFFVAGGSKRGWTTWTTGAVDKRVIGIAPCIIDVLNCEASLQNHFDAYGFWAPAVGNYSETHITDRIHTPEFRKLMSIVDPYSYRDRLTMPKYIINSTGDQFFPPDSWKFYFNDLQGEKNLMYVPNTDHGLNSGAYFRLASFYNSVISGNTRPDWSWEKAEDGSLHVKCVTKPTKVTLWQATNPDARDFRLETLGEKYTESPLAESEPGVYVASVPAPEKGWTAFLVEVQFENPGFGTPFVFTTGVSIVPDTYPGKK